MSEDDRIRAANVEAHRATVMALACKAVMTQHMAKRDFHAGVARDLVMEWVEFGSAPGSEQLLAEVMAELGSMMEASEKLMDEDEGRAALGQPG